MTQPNPQTAYDIEKAFKDFLYTHNHPHDEALHFDTTGFNRFACPHAPNKSNQDARYKIFSDGIPAGYFKCWHCGIESDFSFKQQYEISPDEWKQHLEQMAKRKNEDKERINKSQSTAAIEAKTIFDAATPCITHEYLTKKNVSSYGLRTTNDGTLLVPCYDNTGTLVNLEKIYLDKVTRKFEKRPIKGGKRIGVFYLIGDVTQAEGIIYLCEGYSTAATIHEATGHPVVVSFNAGNLPPVLQAIRQRYPQANIIVASDSDANGVGEKYAKKAIEVSGGSVCLPDFSKLNLNSDDILQQKISDFNDLFSGLMLTGLDRHNALVQVKQQLVSINNVKHIFANDPTVKSGLAVVELSEFLGMELPPRELILSPWLPKSGLCMLHAYRGVGKTHMSLGIAYAVAKGGEFLGWKASQPRNVLYIDGEMPASVLQERLARIVMMSGDNSLPGKLKIITPNLQKTGMPDLATLQGQQAVNEYITDDIELVIIDNLSCLAPSVKENDASDWALIQTWVLHLRARGKSVLLIHHSGKNGGQRGTSKKEDVLDTVIVLERTKDYDSSQGARFTVKYEKSRGFFGDDAKPFVAQLCDDGKNGFSWKTQTVEDSTFEKVVSMLNDDISQKDIAIELELHKSSISRYAARAKTEGLLNYKRGVA